MVVWSLQCRNSVMLLVAGVYGDNGSHVKHTSSDISSKYHIMYIFTMINVVEFRKKKGVCKK